MKQELTQSELNERIAIVRRFKSLLEAQRNKFREYLTVLEKQQCTIEAEDGDALAAHTELSSQIVANITNLQKVIVPMQALYESGATPPAQGSDGSADSADQSGVTQIQTELADLQRRVLLQNEHNQMLLQAHLRQLRTQIAVFDLKNPYRGKRSVYAEKTSAGSMFAVEA